MSLAELRAFIYAHFADNGTGDIDALEMRTALLALCERIEAEGSWQPILTLVANGPFIVLKVADWTGGQGVKPAVNVYAGATGYTTDINQAVNVRGAQGSQGLPGSGQVVAITQPADGYGSPRYYPVCELPAPTGGTYDFADVEFVGKPWDSSVSGGPTTIRLNVQNRGGNLYKWHCVGPVSASYGLCVFVQSDGRLIIYATSDNNFRAIEWRVVNHIQANIFSTNIPAAPTGTAIMNTCLFNIYLPMSVIDARFTTFTSINADGAHPNVFLNTPGQAALSIGANLTGGSSELDFVNSSSVGGGFAWWQQISATSRRFLAFLSGNGWLGIGTTAPVQKLHVEGNAYVSGAVGIGVTAPTETLDVAGRMRGKGLVTTGALPTISKGAAVGSGTAALVTDSNDVSGAVTLNTSGSPLANDTLCNVTFAVPYARAPQIQITPKNAQAANAVGRVWAEAGTQGFSLYSGLTALDNAQSYKFSYLIIA